MNKVLDIVKSKGFIVSAAVGIVLTGVVLLVKKQVNDTEVAEIEEN